MRSIILLFAPILFLSCSQEDTSTPLHNKRVLILGNSITQNGRYVDFMEYYLRTHFPQEKLDIISIGLSSETANGLTEENHRYLRPNVHDRLDRALNLINPEIVLACYGMNDGLYFAPNEEIFDAYKKGIEKLKIKVAQAGAQLILLTPTPFDADSKRDKLSKPGEKHGYSTPYFEYNKVLGSFADHLLSLQAEDLKVIDLHDYLNPILSEMKQLNPDTTFIPDAVHPNETGHYFMAKKILLDLYPTITFSDPISELEGIRNDPLWSLVKERRKVRSQGWLKYIGYTKGETVLTDDISSTQTRVEKLDAEIQEYQNQ